MRRFALAIGEDLSLSALYSCATFPASRRRAELAHYDQVGTTRQVREISGYFPLLVNARVAAQIRHGPANNFRLNFFLCTEYG